MATMRGMQMPEPSSGGGGGLTNALMGIFRERTRAQQQLQLMAYQSAMGVASHVAKTKLGAEALSEAEMEHVKRIHNPATWGEEDWAKEAGRVRQEQFAESGLKSLGGGKTEYQARGTVVQKPKQEKATSTADLENKPSGVKPPSTAVVNEAAQTVVPPNTGQRLPKASKGGYKQQALFTPAGNTTKAAKPAVKKPRVKKPPMTPPAGGMNA